jgi:endogenous inhibitor of DNA gyrase (YacG/DUF329 family)
VALLSPAKDKLKALNCEACGRRVARKARQQKFCSDRCRQFALRENKARTAIKNASRSPDSGPVTNPLFLSNENNELRAAKSGSSLFANAPLNILGGGSWRWPDTPRIDDSTWRKIVRAEVGGAS